MVKVRSSEAMSSWLTCGVRDRPHVPGKLMNPVAQFGGPGRRHEPAPGADEQWIARGGPEPRERSAHGGRTQAQAKGGFADAAFGKKRVEGR